MNDKGECKLTLVATGDWPRGLLGFLAPILQGAGGLCFRVGYGADSGIPLDAIKAHAAEKACLLLQPRELTALTSEAAESLTVPLSRNQVGGRLQLPAYIFHISPDVSEVLDLSAFGPNLWPHFDGVRVAPTDKDAEHDHGRRLFYWFESKTLRTKLLPFIFERAKDQIKAYLRERTESFGGLIRKQEDESDLLARIMTLTVWDEKSATEAIRYKGLVVLLGPHSDNFRLWLKVVLADWPGLNKSYDWWYNRCLGLLTTAKRDIDVGKMLPYMMPASKVLSEHLDAQHVGVLSSIYPNLWAGRRLLTQVSYIEDWRIGLAPTSIKQERGSRNLEALRGPIKYVKSDLAQNPSRPLPWTNRIGRFLQDNNSFVEKIWLS